MRFCLFILFVCFNVSLFSQGIAPDPPEIKYVTVLLPGGDTHFEWNESPSPDEYVYSYRLYWAEKFDGFQLIYNKKIVDVDKATFSYTDREAKADIARVGYTIATKGEAQYGEFSLPHKTIFLKQKYDSCQASINLKWSKYIGWPVEKYIVYCGENDDWQNYSSVGSVNGTDTSFVHTSIIENRQYNYYIEAIKQADTLRSHSNLVHKFTQMPLRPQFVLIDSIINNGSTTPSVNIHFKIDQETYLDRFELNALEESATAYNIIYEFTSKRELSYTDVTSKSLNASVYYQLSVLNSCNNPVVLSEVTNSISVEVKNEKLVNQISWDVYKPGSENSIQYKIFRSVNGNFELLDEFEGVSTYSDNVEDLQYQNNLNEFYYYILAEEHEQSGVLKSLSRSNVKCVFVKPDLRLPNAIAPLTENDGVFKPMVSFESNYRIYIYSRWGDLVYEGKNIGWNGKDKYGSYVKAGTYLYQIYLSPGNDQTIKYKGSVSVFY